MWESWGLDESLKFFSMLMLSLAFFIGIMLIVSQEAFEYFNKALEKEVGLKKRVMPKIENTRFNFVDWLILKYRLVSGMLIAIAAFILLATNR